MRIAAHRNWFYVAVFTVVMIFSSLDARAQHFGVKTNALMWGVATPNAGVEIVVGERSSLDLSAFYKPVLNPDKGVFFNSNIIGFQPEYRYWFNGRPMTREFIGVSAMFADYALTSADSATNMRYVYDGNAVSLGIVGGYSFILGKKNDEVKRWRLELCGGFSVLGFLQKRYGVNDNYDDYFIG